MTGAGDTDIVPLAVAAPEAGARMRLLGGLFEQSFDEPYGEAAVATLLNAPGSRALIALLRRGSATQAAGYVIFRNAADEAEVLSIGVVPGLRRAGLGRALLAAAIADAASAGAAAVFLEVGEDNAPARAMYAAAGFSSVGRRPDYYRRADRSRIAAIVMRKVIRRT